MAREPRYIEAGCIYHVIPRFVDQQWFIRTPDERVHYLKLLGLALERTDWRLLAYAVMSNHIHLAMVAGSQPLYAWARRVHSPFATNLNIAKQRIGPMFVRGPKAYLIEAGGVASLISYIHNNPVRAKVCTTAADSDWTSHRAFIEDAAAPRWLCVQEALQYVTSFGVTRSGFDAWVSDPARAASEWQYTEAHYDRVAAEARDFYTAASKAERETTADLVASVATELLGVPLRTLRSNARSAEIVRAREVVVRSALQSGVSGRSIATVLELSAQRTSELRNRPPAPDVSRLCDEVCRRVEAQWGQGEASSGS